MFRRIVPFCKFGSVRKFNLFTCNARNKQTLSDFLNKNILSVPTEKQTKQILLFSKDHESKLENLFTWNKQISNQPDRKTSSITTEHETLQFYGKRTK